MIKHKHRKPPKNQKYTWGKYPQKTEITPKRNVVPLKQNQVSEVFGIKPFTLKKKDRWRIVETDIQYAVKTINFIYEYFLDNWKLDINSYEWEKIKNKNP